MVRDIFHAMARVPRYKFIRREYRAQADQNESIPIGYGQTISQPSIVAWMTALLELKPGENVLEVGTGSGYQAAILAEFGGVEVFTIEIIPELVERAAKRLQKLGYTKVHIKQGDGYYGWPESAPYDGIIVTAAPDHLPPALAEHLDERGRLVILTQEPDKHQYLWKFIKAKGKLKAYKLGEVSFVPFTGPGMEEHQAGSATSVSRYT